MATKEGPVGPYPDRIETEEERVEYDKLRRRVIWKMPSGLYVIGSAHDGVRNGMTANWVTQVAFEPKLVGVSVEQSALTHQLIRDGGAFSICIIDRAEREIVRKFVKPAEDDGNSLNGYPYRTGVTGCPILETSVAYIDCRLTQSVPAGGHSFFIGEVVDADFLKAEDTEVLRMEDTRMNYGG